MERLPSLWASSRASLLAGGLLVVALLTAYHNTFSVPFLFDDRRAILENVTIQDLLSLGRVFSPPAGSLTVSGRPVVNLSLAVNYALGGTKVWGYHAFNLGVHILASLTLLGVVRRTLLQPMLRDRFGARALPLGLAVALLWSLHPLQTESVTYVVQRAESLMGLFYLLTVYGFIRGGKSSGSRGWYVVSVVACVLGMGTKEVMVSAPLLVWLYDRTFVAGTFWGALRSRWRVYLGLGSSWVLLAWLVMRAGELGSEGAGFQTSVGWGSYGLTQLWAVVHYLRLSVWPYPLVFDYGKMLVTGVPQVGWAALVVGTLISGTMASLARWPTLGFLGCWFLVILAPTTSVLPLAGQTVAEHRMYLSLASVVAVFVLGVYTCLRWRSVVVFLTLAVVSGVLTLQRNTDYYSELSIWSDVAAKSPNNARAQYNLGKTLYQLGELPEAVKRFEAALRVDPRYVKAHSNLGAALFEQGKVREAIRHLEEALRLEPDLAEVHNNLGIALLQEGKLGEALAQYQAAVRLKPDLAEAHNDMGNVLVRQGKVPEAIKQYEEALRLKPAYADAHYNLGLALCEQGKLLEAIRHYEQLVRLTPGDAGTRSQLAWLLATSADGSVRDGARAIKLAEEANRLSGGKDAGILDTLAAAYAEAGRFSEAVRTSQETIELLKAAGQQEAARPIHARLQLYQTGQPYHERTVPER